MPSTAVIVNPLTGEELPRKSASGGASTRAPLGSQMQCGTLAGAVTVLVPSAPSEGSCFAVNDADANAAANAITVDGDGALIDGAATLTLSVNAAFASFVFDRAQWRRLAPRRRLDPPQGPGGAVLLEFLGDGGAPVGSVNSVSGTAPIVSTGGATPAISIVPATAVVPGSMSAADKAKLNGITAGAAVASVSGTAPIASSGGTAPAISIVAATSVVPGSMSAADKAKLDGIQKQGPADASAGVNVDWSAAGTRAMTLANGANAMTFSNNADGMMVSVRVASDAGGSTLTFPAGVQWTGGTVPTQTPTGVDVYTFIQFGAVVVGSVIPDTHA